MRIAFGIALWILPCAACSGEDKCVQWSSSRGCWGLFDPDDPTGQRCESAGCQWGTMCAPARCGTAADADSCDALPHCYWSNERCGSIASVGALPSCESDGGVCDADAGCVVALTCFGEFPDCEAFDTQPACTSNPLCLWQEGRSGLRVGNNERIPVGTAREQALICQWRPADSAEVR